MKYALLDMTTLKLTQYGSKDELNNAIRDLLSDGLNRAYKVFVHHAVEAMWTEAEVC
jgi:hypothetical protein